MKDLNTSVETLTKKTESLLNAYVSKSEKLTAMEGQHQKLLTKVDDLTTEVERLKEENKVLKMASALKGDSENVSETKRKISQMVREIDRCIAMLND